MGYSSESFAEFRRRERTAAEQVARAAAETQKAGEIKAAKERATQARLAALKAEYRFYWNHQIRTRIKESEITSFQRWQELTNGTRRMVIDRISKDPTVYFQGL